MSAAAMKFMFNRSARVRGFSLIESMVALTIGLLLSLGIITVFSAASTTNKTQDALATLQENGRYAATIMSGDLRMLGGQFCSNTSNDAAVPAATAANGWVYQGLAMISYANGVSATNGGAFPDSTTAGVPPNGTSAAYAVSPAVFVQGYKCPAGGTCSPTVPAAPILPGMGTAVGNRVPGTDVLTIRYQSGTGWPYTVSGNTITLAPLAGTATEQGDDTPNFTTGDRALVTTCNQGLVFPVSAAGAVLTAMPDYAGLTIPSGTGKGDPRVFNLSQGFVTISYYLEYRADNSPNATTGRLIPVLMRSVNGTASEIVEGVERLNFTFGVQYLDGTLHYLSADAVQTNSNATNCAPLPAGFDAGAAYETDCLWRSVQSVQVNMLLDSVNNIYTLSNNDVAFRYSPDDIAAGATPSSSPYVPPAATAQMAYNGGVAGPAGWQAGRMLRREFIAMSAVRNGVH